MNSVFHMLFLISVFTEQVFFNWVLLIAQFWKTPFTLLIKATRSARKLFTLKLFHCLCRFYRSYSHIIHAAIFLCCFYLNSLSFSHYSLEFLYSNVYIFPRRPSNGWNVVFSLTLTFIVKSVSANLLIRLINVWKMTQFTFDELQKWSSLLYNHALYEWSAEHFSLRIRCVLRFSPLCGQVQIGLSQGKKYIYNVNTLSRSLRIATWQKMTYTTLLLITLWLLTGHTWPVNGRALVPLMTSSI